MHDEQTLLLVAGNGGFGRVSFYRERYVPRGGPDGGNGGKGGDLIIRGSRHLVTIQHLQGKVKIEAPDGEPGGKRRCFGSNSEPVIVEVPLGTMIWLVAENRISELRRAAQEPSEWGKPQSFLPRNERYQVVKEGEQIFLPEQDAVGEPLPERLLLAEITEDGQEYIVCHGGRGGHGNEAFKGPANTTPMEAEYGEPGDQKLVHFEVKLVADIGLVGFPNAGKSTFLKKVTRANPKIADYPFTTLHPNLGIWNLQQGTGESSFHKARTIVVADIPGLIEGASEGKGLGFQFLRHIERCRGLLFLLSLDEVSIFDPKVKPSELAKLLLDQLAKLRHELAEYQPALLERPSRVVVNKVDILSPEIIAAVTKAFQKKETAFQFFSGVTGAGLEELVSSVSEILAK